jgi:HEAT repeat protein
MLLGQLTDTSRAARTRREAAELLLCRDEPETTAELRRLLEGDNAAAQVAIAEAVAARGGGPQAFVEPLTSLLTGEEASVRAPAARALARYDRPPGQAGLRRLVEVATDGDRPRGVRLAAVEGLGESLGRRSMDALVRLVGGPDDAVRQAAAAALAKRTGIRSYGADAARWRRWWQPRRDTPRGEWLAEMIDTLSRSKTALEAENERLRARLARAMGDLYARTGEAERPAMLMELLRDPLADVRCVGLGITERRVASNQPVPPEVREQVRLLLADEDAAVREAAAMLVARLGAPDAADVLRPRLETEDAPAVRKALLTALGRLQCREALPAVLKEVETGSPDVAAVAASALARIAAAPPLEPAHRQRAAEVLIARYRRAERGSDDAVLREALLTPMGVVGDERFVPVLTDALGDDAATVRLAAVGSLAKLGAPEAVTALEPLLNDPDRGVRQSVIAALGLLGGRDYLPVVLNRTRLEVEPDAAVRQQAWDIAMALLADADVETLESAARRLAEREDAATEHIRVLQLLADALEPAGGAALMQAERRLGEALLSADRPAEAAPHLERALRLSSEVGGSESEDLRLAWIRALLAANDPASVAAIASCGEADCFAKAMEHLAARLDELYRREEYSPVVVLAGEAVEQLSKRMTEARRTALADLRQEAAVRRRAADSRRVEELVGQLTAGDDPARQAARAELQAMGARAVPHLLARLRQAVDGDTPDPAAEQAIVNVLEELDPELTGYDPSAPAEQRLETIDTWMRSYP